MEGSESVTCLRPGAGVVCPITQGEFISNNYITGIGIFQFDMHDVMVLPDSSRS